jgi:hypothetical protein
LLIEANRTTQEAKAVVELLDDWQEQFLPRFALQLCTFVGSQVFAWRSPWILAATGPIMVVLYKSVG